VSTTVKHFIVTSLLLVLALPAMASDIPSEVTLFKNVKIFDGKNGAKRGTMHGGGLGAVRGGVSSSNERQMRYNYYFDARMRGETY